MSHIFQQLALLYTAMEEAYDAVALQLDFSCQGCPDNCCDSYFQHHTAVEWAYLWEGMATLSPDLRQSILERAAAGVQQMEKALAAGERPAVMCPLNAGGLCILYSHRLMICRLHGVPSTLTRPDGRQLHFPGCFRCQELTADRPSPPVLDRTEFFRQLAHLERQWWSAKRTAQARVKLTLAQMLVQEPPRD